MNLPGKYRQSSCLLFFMLTFLVNALYAQSSTESSADAPAFKWPSENKILDHSAATLGLLRTRLSAAIEAWRPTLGTFSSSVCSSENPNHHPLILGDLNLKTGDFLTYTSGSKLNFGMGVGVLPSHLSLAYILNSSQGLRAIVVNSGRVVLMLPLEGYSGMFPVWPRKNGTQAKLSQNKLILATSPYAFNTYQALDSKKDVYILTSSISPEKSFRVEYNAKGISQVIPLRSCEVSAIYTYSGDQLVRVEVSGADQAKAITEYAYSQGGLLARMTAKLEGRPKIGELPTSKTTTYSWQGGKIVKVDNDLDEPQQTYIFSGSKLSQTKQGDVTLALSYQDQKTTVTDSNLKLPKTYKFNQCRLAKSTVNGVSTDETVNVITPTDVKNLEWTTRTTVVKADGSKIDTVFSPERGLLIDSEELFDADGVKRLAYSFENRSDGKLIASTVATSEGSVVSNYQYKDNQLISVKSPKVNSQTFYDDQGRVVRKKNLESDVSFKYADNGLLAEVKDLIMGTANTFTYNSECRIIKKTGPNSSLAYQYKADGRLSSVVADGLNSFSNTYSYNDPKGYITVADTRSPASTQGYSYGNVKQKTTREYDFYGNLLDVKLDGEEFYNYKVNSYSHDLGSKYVPKVMP